MKPFQRAGVAFLVLLLTYSFTRLWLGSALAESVWSQLNQWIESGQNPGLTSDVELVVSVLAAFILASAIVLFLFKLFGSAGKRAG
jgi:hypothetical protein